MWDWVCFAPEGLNGAPAAGSEGTGDPSPDGAVPETAAATPEPAAVPGTDTVAPAPQESPWYERRIAELTAQKGKKDRDIQELQQQLTQLQAKATPAGQAAQGRVFTEAELDQEANNRAQRIAMAQNFNREVDTMYFAGKETFPDWERSVETLRATGDVSVDFVEQVLATGQGKEIIYNLGRDPEKAQRIMKMEPTRRAVELVKIGQEAVKPAAASKAPAPISGKVGVAGSSDPDALDSSVNMQDWVAKRNKQVADKQKARGR